MIMKIETREEILELIPRLRELKGKRWFLENEVKKFAAKLEKILTYTNAKVHDVSYYTYEDWKKDFPILNQSEVDGEFSFFLEREWEYFTEDNEFFKGVDREYLGRTSSFRMVGSHLSEIETSVHGSSDYHEQLLAYLEMDELDIEYHVTNGFLVTSEEFEGYLYELDTTLDNAEYILDEMKSEFKNVRRLYQMLDSFKKSQVNIFKEYLTHIVEMVETDEPARRLDVVNFTSYQKEEKFEFSATIDVHKSLLESFLDKFEVTMELVNGKAYSIGYSAALSLIAWLGGQETEEYFMYDQSIKKTNGI